MSSRLRLLLLVTLGWVCAYQYIQIIGVQCNSACAEMHVAIVEGTMDAPYRYRLLAALLVEGIRVIVPDVPMAYGIAHLIAFPVMFLCLDGWLRRWLSPDRALIGGLLVAVYMPVMLQVWGIALYTALEVIFLCLGLTLLMAQPRRWEVGFAIITVIATLNRETALLLPLAYLSICRNLRLSALFGLCWLLPFVGLRWALGAAPDALTVEQTWAMNTGGGWYTIMAGVKHLLLLPIWLLVAVQLRCTAPVLWRLLLPAGLYLALVAVFALWHEVRLLLVVLVFTLPVALMWIEDWQPKK